MSFLSRINAIIDRVLRFVITTTLGAMLVLIFVQVISRYVFQYSLTFSEELARYLFVWTVFLGIPVAQRMGRHMTVGVITERVSGMPLKVLRVVANILTAVFMIIILKNGILMVQRTVFQLSSALQIPMSYVYYALPISAIAMILNMVEELVKILKTPGSETKPNFSAE